jgi:hypoxanthine phosphoribosyltransferase
LFLNLEEVDILYTPEQIREKVKDLGSKISVDYKGESLLVVGILKGAFVFMADLIREIDIPMELDFMSVSSYGTSSETSGEVRIMKDLDFSAWLPATTRLPAISENHCRCLIPGPQPGQNPSLPA